MTRTLAGIALVAALLAGCSETAAPPSAPIVPSTPPSNGAPSPGQRAVLPAAPVPSQATRLPETRVDMHWDDTTGSVIRQIGDAKFPKDEDLERAIAAAHAEWVRKGEPDAAVTIDADTRVPWKQVIVVMDMAKRCGVEKIEFAFGEPDRK